MVIVLATYISILLSAGSLIWGFAQLGYPPFTRWLFFFGAFWVFAQSQHWWWVHAVTMILTVAIAALGIALGLAPGWILAASIFALITWDLSEFRRRSRFELSHDKRRELERGRIRHITILAFIGLFICSILMWLRRELTIEWGILIVLVLILGLPQLMQRKAESS